MNRRLLISVCFVISTTAVGPSFGVPSQACVTGPSGISLCVQFDNLQGPPDQGTDFDVTFDSSHVPSVSLLRGSVPNGIDRQWRVWSHDASGNAADIGQI